DARIMMQWMDHSRKAFSSNPPVLNWSRDTDGWEKQSITFKVPEGAGMLKFMPCPFRVEAGTFDLDDVVLRVAPDAEEIAKNKPEYDQRAPLFSETFTAPSWTLKNGSQILTEAGNKFLQLHSAES